MKPFRTSGRVERRLGEQRADSFRISLARRRSLFSRKPLYPLDPASSDALAYAGIGFHTVDPIV